MATFEELFPDQAQEPFVPIETGRVAPELRQARMRARSALDFGTDQAQPIPDAFAEKLGRAPTPPSGGETSMGDYGRAAVSGVGGLGQAAAGAGEYTANYFAGDRNTPFQQMMGDLADQFGEGRRNSGEFAQDWFQSMSPEAQQRAMREITTLDPNKTIWQGGAGEFLSSIGLKMSQAAPSTLVTLLPGALIMRAGLGRGGIAYLGASEGALSMGSIAANIADEIEQAPEAELMQSERYQQLRQQMDDQSARQALIREAQGYAPVIGGLAVGAISAVAGRYLEPVFTGGGGGMFRRAGRGFVSEGALQEGPQSAAEQIAQNVAAQTFDSSRGTFEGAGEAFGQGVAVGGPMGAGFSAALGRGPRQALPPPGPVEEAPAAPPGPEGFDQVFTPQTPPPGGWRGGDIESGSLPDIDTTGQRLIAAGPVDPALQAALNARADNKIQDMFEQQGPNAGTPQQFAQNPWPVTQQEMPLQQPVTDVATIPGQQQNLPLTERVRGVGRAPVEPMAGQPLVEDMSAPPGFSTAVEPPNLNGRRPTRADFIRARRAQDTAGMVRDPRQRDMFNEPQLMPDEPSAEPIGDLNAQLADLADPDSPRLGVYLSSANMQQVGELPSVGVPLANFDGKGGTLIAKNRQAAEQLLALRDEGGDMQQVLGLATGAGTGKPVDGSIAVQQRDEQGNVVQESLVATPEEADALASEFDAPGREGVILSADMAIRRREQRIAAEQETARTGGIRKRARRRVEDAGGETAERDTAAELAVLQDQLTTAEKGESDAPTRSERIKAREAAKSIRARMDTLREEAERTVRSTAKPKAFEDARASLESLKDEEIDRLPDEQVEELFREAANVASGSRVKRKSTKDESREVAEAGASTTFTPHGKTLEEIIEAHPARSQKLKLIGRVKRMLRIRAMGGKTKTAPITGKGGIRKGVGGAESTAVRKSELKPTKALDLEPPREMSQPERAKHNARVRKTYSTLDKQVQAFATRAEKLNQQLYDQSVEREADGNPPHRARDAIYGRAYLNTLLRYGQMLQALRPRSTAGLKEVERFNSLVEDLMGEKGDKFLVKLSRSMQAESEAQAKAAIRLDPVVLRNMGTRSKREAHALESAANIRERIARAKRLHDVWHTNAKFEQHVAPLMQKLIGYVTHDTSLANVASERRGLGYIPTFNEMRNLRFTLREFKQTNREELYKPLKRWFEDYGYKFDDSGDLVLAKNAAQFDYVQPDKLLENDRSAFRNAPLNYNQKVAVAEKIRQKARIDAERKRRNALTPGQRRREDLDLARRIEKDRVSIPPSDAARVANMSYEQRRAYESLLRQRPLYLELAAVHHDLPSLRRAAEAVADTIEGYGYQSTSGEHVLKAMRSMLPDNHAYQPLIQRLLNLNMSDVVVSWADGMGNEFGRFVQEEDAKGKWRHITFNRARLNEIREQGIDPSGFFMHSMLHEMVHAATAGAIRNSRRAQMAIHAIMRAARTAAGQQYIDLTSHFSKTGDAVEFYGFRDNIPEEFIAEAFTNSKFQDLLREIKLEPKRTAWQAILDIVKRLLGLGDTPKAENVLDAVLATTDRLFTGEFTESTRGAQASLAIKDDFMRPLVANATDKAMQSWRVTNDMMKGGVKAPLPAMSMEQIRDTFGNDFGGSSGPLAKYMRSFFQRDANNSENLEPATKLIRDWVRAEDATDKTRDSSVELSRVMTEATLYGMHPDLPLSDAGNAHITSNEQKARHRELAARFRAMPQDFRELYGELRSFYKQAIATESSLQVINALRGVLGDAAVKNISEADVRSRKLNTKDGLEAAFGDQLTPDQRTLIAKLGAMGETEGPYFPLSRYGDYVVSAEREIGRKHFDDRKAARAYYAAQEAKDPTLDVRIVETDTGFDVVTKETEVRMAETRSEAEQHYTELATQYGTATRPQLKANLNTRDAAIQSNAALSSILGSLADNAGAQNAIKNFYLRSLADTSFRKHEIKRENRRGVNYEHQQRSFANYAKAWAYYTSQLRYGWQMAGALQEMQKRISAVARGEEQSDADPVRMGEVLREIDTRNRMTTSLDEPSKGVRFGTTLSQFAMLTSPSYWMINLSQPYMVTLPWLAARTSLGDATAALASAQKMIADPLISQAASSWGGIKSLVSRISTEESYSVLDQVFKQIERTGGGRGKDYISMLKTLKRNNVLDMTMMTELRDISEGLKGGVVQKTLDASRIMSHLTEVNNRIMTALAAYDLYRNKGATHEIASEFAQHAVSSTQFNYSSGNTPRIFQARGPLGSMGPLVFQFMKYPQHMYALLIRNMVQAVKTGGVPRKEAVRTLMGLFTTHAIVGGLSGAMLQPLKWAIGLTMAALGDDDDVIESLPQILSGEKFERGLRKVAADVLGTELGMIASRGLPTAAGIDVSARMSLGTLYMMDINPKSSESLLGSLVTTFGGPTVNLGANYYDGVQYMRQGQFSKGFEAFMPKFAKDVFRMLRYSSEGLTDATGKEIVGADKMSAGELFAQAMGFQPASISEKYAQRAAINAAKSSDDNRRASLLRRFNNADPDERSELLREISEFNRSHPAATISRSQLLRSQQSFRDREARMRRYGVDLQGDDVRYAEEGEIYQ